MKNSEILRKAQQLIVKHGWVKGKMGNPEEGYCLLGALESAMAYNNIHEDVFTSEPYNLVHKIIGPNFPITEFNDDYAKNATEIIEVLNRAIQLAKLKERASETCAK